LNEFCPRCGTARIGAFRFCRGCRLDYDTLPADEIGSATALSVAPIPARPTLAPGSASVRLTRRRLAIIGIAVFFGLAAIGSINPPDPESAAVTSPTSTPTSQATRAVTTAQPAAPLVPGPTFGPAGDVTEASVVRVVDGDTIVVSYGGGEYRVRYIGIDAPETVDPNDPVDWMGPQATVANAALVEGEIVYLEKDVSEVDRFDRLLRYVWLVDGTSWTLVNLELVRQGVAIAKSYPPDVRYDHLYRTADVDARDAGLGLFAATPAPTPKATPKATPKPTPKATPKATPKPTPKPTPKATPKPTPKPTKKPKPPADCHPSYEGACLKPDASDYDCAGGSGNGPYYVDGPIRVVGYDEYDLDRDGDGFGCD